MSDRRPSRVEALRLLAGMAAVTAVMLALGFALTRLPSLGPLRGWDAAVAQWWVSQRTPLGDTLSDIGSTMADTPVVIAVAATAVIGLRLWTGRWWASLVVATALLGELLYFLALTSLVGRDRPDVSHLDQAPPTSSFPSGHTGAAVALYVGLAALLWWGARDRRLVAPAVAVLLLMPMFVGTARLYRGMHYASDVVSGAVGGLLWLAVVLAVLGTGPRRDDPAELDLREGLGDADEDRGRADVDPQPLGA